MRRSFTGRPGSVVAAGGNAQDGIRMGEPGSWPFYHKRRGVWRHLRFGVFDKPHVACDAERLSLTQDFKRIWLSLAIDFSSCLEDWRRERGETVEMNVLMHCYGGINRSCAGACVLLMRFVGLRLDDAMALWREHRAYYARFLNRPYMIHALIDVEKDFFGLRTATARRCRRSCMTTRFGKLWLDLKRDAAPRAVLLATARTRPQRAGGMSPILIASLASLALLLHRCALRPAAWGPSALDEQWTL